MRRFRFFFIPHGPTYMCVYKGVKGPVVKHKKEAGVPWKVYFGIRPTPIWCGWTTLELPPHYHVSPVEWEAGKSKWVEFLGNSPAAAAAGVWAAYDAAGWGGGGDRAGIEVVLEDYGGGDWLAQAWGQGFFADGKIEGWWANYPDIHPEKMVITFDVHDFGPDVGGIWLPDFFISRRMDQVKIEIEIDVSHVVFPPNHFLFEVMPDPTMQGYYCFTPGGICILGAYVLPYWGMTIDYYAGGGGWEWIDIPDWIFELPGKYWLAMVDENGNMLPGPYLPLN